MNGAHAATQRPAVKRNIASLVGGFVIALGIFALWTLIAMQRTGGHPGIGLLATGAGLAAVIGIWIRIADL